MLGKKLRFCVLVILPMGIGLLDLFLLIRILSSLLRELSDWIYLYLLYSYPQYKLQILTIFPTIIKTKNKQHPKMKTTHLISKLLISLMVLYHVYIHQTDKTQTQRYQQNAHNNIHKYLYFIKGTYLFEVVYLYAGGTVLVVMGVGACAMVVSRWWGWKAICILGVIGYNVLIPYFYVLVGNYYAMKQWIGVVAALLYLTVAESEANQNQQLQAKSQQNTTKEQQHNSAQKKVQ